jgi:hypothetical protein
MYSSPVSKTTTNLTNSTTSYTVLAFMAGGIQNGPTCGFALSYPNGTLIEVISYEGSFTYRGIVSTDVIVNEDGIGTSTGSIQRCIDNINRWIVNDNTNTRGSSNYPCPTNPVLGSVCCPFSVFNCFCCCVLCYFFLVCL